MYITCTSSRKKNCTTLTIFFHPFLATHQALLAGRDKILPPMGLHDFMLEVLVVLFPAIASMVWPSLNFTVVLSMAFTSENSRVSLCTGRLKVRRGGCRAWNAIRAISLFTPQHSRWHTPSHVLLTYVVLSTAT